MKVWISNYRNHWLSPYTILERVLFWKDWDNISYDEPWVERWSNRLEPVCKLLQWISERVRPRFEYVKLDRWDTWSMDHTLATIVLPMLQQLHDTKHGAPMVDDEDVPEELRSTSAPAKENEWDTDDNHFLRWDWVLAEMIWAFEQKVTDDDESEFFDHSECGDIKDFVKDTNGYLDRSRVDWDGLKRHQERKQNGFRLFGKYYQALWT
jgi:hypothetical protein